MSKFLAYRYALADLEAARAAHAIAPTEATRIALEAADRAYQEAANKFAATLPG